MIGCLRTRFRKQPIIALYFEFENELKFYNLEADCFTIIVFLLSCGSLRFEPLPRGDMDWPVTNSLSYEPSLFPYPISTGLSRDCSSCPAEHNNRK